MLTVVLLALASATSSACSTVAKHASASRPVPSTRLASALPPLLATMLTNPLWLAGLLFDLGGVSLQVMALRYGDLSVVQPILTASLVISLGLSHAFARTRLRKREVAWSLCLIAGLVLFLVVSGALGPQGEESIGRKIPGTILSIVAGAACLVCLWLARRSTGGRRARVLAVVVAILYVAMAGLIKSSTRIATLRGWSDLLLSWQLWCLVACAVAALVCAQAAFAAGPLTKTLPVIASLDPLFSVVLGVVVYGETLRHESIDIPLEVAGLGLLVLGVVGLSRISAEAETEAAVVEANR